MSTPQPSPVDQPKIVQTLLRRTLIVLLAFAAIWGGLRWMQSRNGDFDNGGDSTGMIAAVRLEKDGQQVVLIKPGGKVVGTTSWKDGVTDREPVWSPDGKFLYFCSDRKDNTFNVFRWNPQSDDAQTRTAKNGSRSNPTFAPGQSDDKPLIVVGGFVRELDPSTGKAQQILPPVNAEIAQAGSGDETGTEGSLSVYGALGKSFRIARYLPGKSLVVAVMRRDEGESLILQSMTPDANGKLPKPLPVVAGEHVDFDIDPTNGNVVFTVQDFRWIDPAAAPEAFRKNGHLTVPFRNMVGLLDPARTQQSVIAPTANPAPSNDPAGWAAPRVSPDGSKLLLVGGMVDESGLRPQELLSLPLKPGGIAQASSLTKGEVYEPSWSVDAKRIVYAKRTGGRRDLFTMNADGTEEKSLTNGQGDFTNPLFSPMLPK